MQHRWRFIYLALTAALFVSVFLPIAFLRMNPLPTPKSLVPDAQAHAGVLGVLAGFMATILVIFLTGAHPHTSKQKNKAPSDVDTCRLAAIATYLCGFLHSILGSFQYASFTGFATEWGACIKNSASDPSLANYLFTVLGFEYLVAAYVGFFGLVLTVRYFTLQSPVNDPIWQLSRFMLFMVYWLASAWLFADLAGLWVGSGHSAKLFILIGLTYLTPVAATVLIKWPRGSNSSAIIFLSATLAASLIAGSVISGWYARVAYFEIDEAVLRLAIFWTVLFITLVLAFLFAAMVTWLNWLESINSSGGS